MKIKENSIDKLFFEFKNNVHCRYDSNQHKATVIWEKLKLYFPQKVQTEFEIEWNHYLLNQIDDFGEQIKALEEFLKKTNHEQ